MKLLRCQAGHYYDADTFASCPHCVEGDLSATIESGSVAGRPSPSAVPDITVASSGNTAWSHVPVNNDPGVTVPLTKSATDDNDSTIGVYTRRDAPIQPVAGWLVCTEGPSLGRDYRIVSGRNSIGRDASNVISIAEDRSISRTKHVIVTYDPQSNTFFVQPGESTEMCYLNGKVVLDSVRLSIDDVLKLGNTSLMFIPCCSERFTWDVLRNGGNADD